MSDGEIRVEVVREGDTVVVSPEGDVDLSRSPTLRNALREAQGPKPRRVIVDLSLVEYMDSSGVATLVEAFQIARRNGSRMVLCGLTDRVRSIFEIARLDTIFTISATREAARDA
jgi:anti-sigma B factor antagonist